MSAQDPCRHLVSFVSRSLSVFWKLLPHLQMVASNHPLLCLFGLRLRYRLRQNPHLRFHSPRRCLLSFKTVLASSLSVSVIQSQDRSPSLELERLVSHEASSNLTAQAASASWLCPRVKFRLDIAKQDLIRQKDRSSQSRPWRLGASYPSLRVLLLCPSTPRTRIRSG